jgi:DUF2970 family protein
MAAMQADTVTDTDESKPAKPGPLHAAKTILWAFLGVRRRQDHESMPLTPVQIVIAGLIGAALFVLTILTVVRLVLR